MKKIFAVILMLCILCAGCASGIESEASDIKTENSTDQTESTTEAEDTQFTPSRIAMITYYGDVDDKSYNQMTYEGCLRFAVQYDVDFKVFQPEEDSTLGRVAATELAIENGYNVIVMPGYSFGGTIVEVAPLYPDVKFIALDVVESDLLEYAVANAGESYDYNPDNWEIEDYVDLSNVYCCNFREEQAGFLAGYATVKLGYTDLGFVGAMAIPIVIRYGYGFLQGANAAAAEVGVNVSVKYGYAHSCLHADEVPTDVDKWYMDGTQVVFACGGQTTWYVEEAARRQDGMMIGLDIAPTAQAEDLTVTSAMKGLAEVTEHLLEEIILIENWPKYAGKIERLGLTAESDIHYVYLPEYTQWSEQFTTEDYHALIEKLRNGTFVVSDDINREPVTEHVTVEFASYAMS